MTSTMLTVGLSSQATRKKAFLVVSCGFPPKYYMELLMILEMWIRNSLTKLVCSFLLQVYKEKLVILQSIQIIAIKSKETKMIRTLADILVAIIHPNMSRINCSLEYLKV